MTTATDDVMLPFAATTNVGSRTSLPIDAPNDMILSFLFLSFAGRAENSTS